MPSPSEYNLSSQEYYPTQQDTNGKQFDTSTQHIPQVPSSSGHSGGAHHQHQNNGHELGLKRVKSVDICRVCGDAPARMHYGVPTCFGCKGFFRRTLKRTKEYTCRYNGSCVVDRYERNSCRYCRFKRCLEVGMDPKAVRPDRDAAGRSHPMRHRRSRNSLGEINFEEDDSSTDDWIRKLPVDMRTLLMQIMNMELLVNHGDTMEESKKIYPLNCGTLRQLIEEPHILDGKRSEIRYETFRQVQADELQACAHRRLIAAIDCVDHLFSMMDLHNINDKIAIVKSCYAPLSIFSFAAATAKVTKQHDILCLCNYGYVPKNLQHTVDEPFHLGNKVVERAIDELVEPMRSFNFKDQEMALMGAIVVLNPHIKSLTAEAAEQIADLRDRVQETLYNVVRESHPKEVASSRFGNLLLFLPTIVMLGNLITENLQFVQSFGQQKIDSLLGELLNDNEPGNDSHNMNVEDVLSMADHTDQFIRHSQSSSSISSLNSHSSRCSGSSFEHGYASAASCQNIQNESLNPNESDPDYNVTLTQNCYTDIRQNVPNTNQPMDVDSCCGNSIRSNDGTSPNFYEQKPRFFIEPGQQQQSTTTVINGSQHVFTVETNRDPMYQTQSSKSAQCLFRGYSIQQQQQQQQISRNGYNNCAQYQQRNPIQYNMNNGNNMQGQPLLYEDPNQQQQGSLSKSQSYPCYGYILDDNDYGPPTLQSNNQQTYFQNCNNMCNNVNEQLLEDSKYCGRM